MKYFLRRVRELFRMSWSRYHKLVERGVDPLIAAGSIVAHQVAFWKETRLILYLHDQFAAMVVQRNQEKL